MPVTSRVAVFLDTDTSIEVDMPETASEPYAVLVIGDRVHDVQETEIYIRSAQNLDRLIEALTSARADWYAMTAHRLMVAA